MTYDIVEGTTNPLQFQLLEVGVPITLIGITVTIVAEDRTGATVSIGTITVIDAVNGIVQLTPTNGTVFVPSTGPYLVRWQLTDGSGNVSYVPTSNRDIWNIVGK